MRRRPKHPGKALAGALLLLSSSLAAQDFLLSRIDGSQVAGRPVALRGHAKARRLLLESGDRQVEVPLVEILGLHGPAPRVLAPVAAYLAGGDELKGELRGGDEAGESFLLDSAVLGPRRVLVDRMQTLVFLARARGAGPDEFRIAADAPYDEALFRKAGRGFDVVGGELERFAAEGIQFVATGRSVPRLHKSDKLTGMACRGAVDVAQPGDWLLVTSAGDRLRVALLKVTPAALVFRTEFGEVTLPQARVAALSLRASSRRYLSDLVPQRVSEAGSQDGLDPAPLFTYRRDKTVSGGRSPTGRSPSDGFLVVGGRTYAKGLGVHSRCTLTYRVPPGMHHFYARVAIDDEVASLGVKGDADASVRLGGKLLFTAKALHCGQAPRSVGVLAVTPGALLTLEVDFGKGLFLGDRVDWLSAVFLR